jgi:hypothetical protein
MRYQQSMVCSRDRYASTAFYNWGNIPNQALSNSSHRKGQLKTKPLEILLRWAAKILFAHRPRDLGTKK